MMKLRVLGAVVTVLVLAGCSNSPATPTAASSPSRPATTAVGIEEPGVRDRAPAFEVTEAPTSGGGGIRVTVDQTLTGGEASLIMEVLMLDYTDPGGYFVSINCSSGGTDAMDNRLANGKFAVGDLGEAQTGLRAQSQEAEIQPDADCPVTIPTPDSPTGALTAQQIVDGFAAAGLPVTDARDNTGSNCPDRKCSQMVTTDDVTVLSFPDASAATVYVKTWGPADLHRLGAIVLSYGAARTPAKARPRYEATLKTLSP